jgi:hypothetical protein
MAPKKKKETVFQQELEAKEQCGEGLTISHNRKWVGHIDFKFMHQSFVVFYKLPNL